jgi:mono/diheme cytochrome c family protein
MTRRLLFPLLLVAAACSARPGGPGQADDGDWRTDAGPPPGEASCRPAQTSEPLPARADLFGASSAGNAPTTMFTRDLFGLFKSHCGACHVEASLGGFHVTSQTFAMVVGDNVLARIRSDDSGFFMPPPAAGGMPFSSRPPTDPVVQLVGLLQTWIDQGRPKDLFTVSTPGGGQGASPYLMSDFSIDHLTNLGDCVPTPGLVGQRVDRMDQRDGFFAAASELPDSLADTDLDTLDGATLAAEGLVAYAPTYPLWTDGAGKLRYIRVPRGQSVSFDAAKQAFTIPANTRFYKTFLKKVTDAKGYTSWRKIETRVIVSRPDVMNADGTVENRALYGTYVWNDSETEAHLLRDPLRDGTPFRDRLISVVVDEPAAAAIQAQHPADPVYELEEAHTGIVRHYAIPGSARCVQCHMGSPSASFVLGFTPIQLSRRPGDEGGVYERAAADELDQLQRFIDYGVVTGIHSAAEVTKLEAAEGERKPRNDHELAAQAYMLGNCSHCHNPRGFPSVKNPELRAALDFLPSPEGGIFQFPLERTSPLRRRGADLDIAMPYITPSLREYPVAPSSTANWAAKWVECALSGDEKIYERTPEGLKPYPSLCGPRITGVGHYDAPWRSLIYRNVDTPFSYADDFVIYPHMPMSSPGFDCRAPRLMAEWMLSIPARRVNLLNEELVPSPDGQTIVDTSPQPYAEVKPGDADYDTFAAASAERLRRYDLGARHGYCPDDGDIVDHAVLNRVNRGDPLVPPAEGVYDRQDPTKLLQHDLGVPVRAHWVVTDLTEAPGQWFPRRPDWADVLVAQHVDDPSLTAEEREAQRDLVTLLQDVKLGASIRSFARTEVPFGLWQEKPGCNFAGQKKVSEMTGDARPPWMDRVAAPPDGHVYQQAPGEAVFTTVCINCHGPKADSRGLLADAIMMMTGGDARVANLRDGLLGPASDPGANRTRVFGANATPEVGANDWAARYLAWMTLGGTQRVLPPALLNIVAATPVLGARRASNQISPTGSPNMLKLAKELCQHTLPAINSSYDLGPLFDRGHLDWGAQTGLIDVNGDAEMWLRLCSLDNRRIVRVPYLERWSSGTGTTSPAPRLVPELSLYYADAYPANAPVLDHRGRIVTGITADNLFPMCIRKPSNADELAAAEAYLAARPVKVPYCPPELFADNDRWRLASIPDPEIPGRRILTDARRWSLRGAINAALSVFLYLDAIEHGEVTPKPRYNQCEQL